MSIMNLKKLLGVGRYKEHKPIEDMNGLPDEGLGEEGPEAVVDEGTEEYVQLL